MTSVPTCSEATSGGCVPTTTCNGTTTPIWSSEYVKTFCEKVNLKDQNLCEWTKEYSCPGDPVGTKGVAKNDGTMSFRCCCPNACNNVNCTKYLGGKLCPLHVTDNPYNFDYAWDDGSNEINCCCPKVSPFPLLGNSLCNDIVKTSTNITCGVECGALDFLQCSVPWTACKVGCLGFPDCEADCDKVQNACFAYNLQNCYCNCARKNFKGLSDACLSMEESCNKSATEPMAPVDPNMMCKDFLASMTASMATTVEGPELEMAIDILETIFTWVCSPIASIAWDVGGYTTAMGKAMCSSLFGSENNISVKGQKLYYGDVEVNNKNAEKIKYMVKKDINKNIETPPPKPPPSSNIGIYIIPLVISIIIGIVFTIVKYTSRR